MKKINYGSFVCEVSVDPDYMLLKHGLCDYERDTIAYAVERFFTRCRKAGKACTEESIQIRVAKGKAKRKRAFMYLAPAILMELPEGWVRVWGEVNAVGVEINKIEILREHPCFAEYAAQKDKNSRLSEKSGSLCYLVGQLFGWIYYGMPGEIPDIPCLE